MTRTATETHSFPLSAGNPTSQTSAELSGDPVSLLGEPGTGSGAEVSTVAGSVFEIAKDSTRAIRTISSSLTSLPSNGLTPACPLFCPRFLRTDSRTILIGSEAFGFAQLPSVNTDDGRHHWGQAPSLEIFHSRLRETLSEADLEEQFLVVEAPDGSVTWYEVGEGSEIIESGDLTANTTVVRNDLIHLILESHMQEGDHVYFYHNHPVSGEHDYGSIFPSVMDAENARYRRDQIDGERIVTRFGITTFRAASDLPASLSAETFRQFAVDWAERRSGFEALLFFNGISRFDTERDIRLTEGERLAEAIRLASEEEWVYSDARFRTADLLSLSFEPWPAEAVSYGPPSESAVPPSSLDLLWRPDGSERYVIALGQGETDFSRFEPDDEILIVREDASTVPYMRVTSARLFIGITHEDLRTVGCHRGECTVRVVRNGEILAETLLDGSITLY